MSKLVLKILATTIILVLFLAPAFSRSSASPSVFENGKPSMSESNTEVLYAISSAIVPNLFTIDPVTGMILSSIPITNAEALFGGLSYDGTQLFSIDGYNDPLSDRTFRIDPSSGEGTIVGDTGYNWNFRSVELHPQTGVLYATQDRELYTIDKITGKATVVAPISGPTLDQVTALAIKSDGKAYVTDTGGTGLFQLDLVTGEVTHLGDLNLCNWFISDLAFNHSDQLWAVCLEEGGLYIIDIGNVTATFQFVSGSYPGLAFSGLTHVDVELDIDIYPNKYPNIVYPTITDPKDYKGLILVSVLTTPDFNARTVDPASVRFGPAGASAIQSRVIIKDVDRDGDADITFGFRIVHTGIKCGDTSATLSGSTFDGQHIYGTDSIQTQDCTSPYPDP